MENKLKSKWITQEGYYLFIVSDKMKGYEKVGYRDATEEEIKRFGERIDKQDKEFSEMLKGLSSGK